MTTTAITYIGGPTTLLEYAGLRIVTDPTFDAPGDYPEPGETTLVKTAGPALSRSEIGTVDLVLLSHHEHKDNLDYEGTELLASGVPTVSTPKAASDLFGGGVIGLDASLVVSEAANSDERQRPVRRRQRAPWSTSFSGCRSPYPPAAPRTRGCSRRR